MSGVSQARKGEQGTGLERATTCVKVQRQDSMEHLDNWKKLLMAHSYAFFSAQTCPLSLWSCSQLSQGDLDPFLFPEALWCLFLKDSLHDIVTYLDCNNLSVLLKTVSSLKAGNYVWFCLMTATSKQWQLVSVVEWRNEWTNSSFVFLLH